jgi:hypothetical protein
MNMGKHSEIVIFESQLVELNGEVYECYRIDFPSANIIQRTKYWYFPLGTLPADVEKWARERWTPNDVSWQWKLPF